MIWWSALAAAATVQVIPEPRQLAVGQTGRVYVVVGFGRDEQAGQVQPPVVSSGPGAQVRYTGQGPGGNRIVQGKITRTLQFEYSVAALTEGTWTLGPVAIVLGTGTVRSEPARLVVTAKDTRTPDEATVFAGFERGDALSSEITAWEGEVLLYRRGLRYRDTLSARFSDPALEGFRTLQEGDPVERRYSVEDPSGTVMVTEGLLPVVASGVGRHELGPVTARVQIPVGRRFGLVETRTEVVASDPLVLTVKSLPPAPPGFSGLIGDFQVRSTVPARSVAAGESVPFTLVLSGAADIEGLKLPDPTIPGVNAYPAEPVVKAVVKDDLDASATFKWALVPTVPGTLDLPDYEIVVFSPSKGAYETLRVELPTLEVTPGKDGTSEVRAFGTSPTDVVFDDGSVARSPYAWGFSRHYDAAPVLVGAASLALVPAGLVLLTDGLRAAVAARRRRRPVQVDRPPTAMELLTTLPPDAESRLATLDHALRLAEVGREGDGRILDLRKRLGRARFGDGGADPSLEEDVRRLVQVIEREAA